MQFLFIIYCIQPQVFLLFSYININLGKLSLCHFPNSLVSCGTFCFQFLCFEFRTVQGITQCCRCPQGCPGIFLVRGEYPRVGLKFFPMVVTPRVDRGFAWEQVYPLLARSFPQAWGNLEIPNDFQMLCVLLLRGIILTCQSSAIWKVSIPPEPLIHFRMLLYM